MNAKNVDAVVHVKTQVIGRRKRKMFNTKYSMSWWEKLKLRKIARRIVWQSMYHQSNIVEYYKILAEAARDEFTEDNDTTLDDLLLELHRKASKEILPHSNVDGYTKKLKEENKELKAKLKKIEEFGFANPGCGYTCAKIAKGKSDA